MPLSRHHNVSFLFPFIDKVVSNYRHVIQRPLIKSKSHAWMIDEQWGIWEAGRLPLYFTTITVEHCVKVNKTAATIDGEQQLWQRDTDWDVDRSLLDFCPSCCGPWPALHRYPGSFPIHVNTHRYALFPLSVYSHMLIPINLLLVWCWRRSEGRGSWRWVCLGARSQRRWVKRFLHTTPRASADRLHWAWTSFYTEQMWSPTCFT